MALIFCLANCSLSSYYYFQGHQGKGQTFEDGIYWLGGYFYHENKTWKWEDDTEIDFEKFGELFEIFRVLHVYKNKYIFLLHTFESDQKRPKNPIPSKKGCLSSNWKVKPCDEKMNFICIIEGISK